jgi:hypothetical protein
MTESIQKQPKRYLIKILSTKMIITINTYLLCVTPTFADGGKHMQLLSACSFVDTMNVESIFDRSSKLCTKILLISFLMAFMTNIRLVSVVVKRSCFREKKNRFEIFRMIEWEVLDVL